MRGTIECYDGQTRKGVIRTRNGKAYIFSGDRLLRRSKEPRPQATAVFRLKNGKVHKIAVLAHQRQWGWLACALEAMLYLPIALTE